MAKIKWNADKILSISAMTMSFLTLLIFIYQTNLLSKQNYISILPYLSMSSSTNSALPLYSLDLENHGVGPAIIESVHLSYKGSTYDLVDYDNRMYLLLTEIIPELDSIINWSHSPLNKGLAIPANSTYNVLSVGTSMEEFLLMSGTIKTMLDEGMNYEIRYSSIQDEHWLIRYDSEGPQKLN